MPSEKADPAAAEAPRLIRKYANRRLYDTEDGRFVTFDDLLDMVKRGDDFKVREARTERDITASVLAQILAEEAGRGNELLPLDYLRQLLRLYHDGLGGPLASYLTHSMELFASNQRRLFRQLPNPFDPSAMLDAFRELGARNAAFLERLHAPPAAGARDGPAPEEEEPDDIAALKAQLAAIQRRLDEIERRGRS